MERTCPARRAGCRTDTRMELIFRAGFGGAGAEPDYDLTASPEQIRPCGTDLLKSAFAHCHSLNQNRCSQACGLNACSMTSSTIFERFWRPWGKGAEVEKVSCDVGMRGCGVLPHLLPVTFPFWVHHDMNRLYHTFPLARAAQPSFRSLPWWTEARLPTHHGGLRASWVNPFFTKVFLSGFVTAT